MTYRIIPRLRLLLALIALSAVLLPVPVLAQNQTGLQMMPLRSKPSIKPGDTTTASITLTNQEPESQVVTINVQRFNTINEVYDYKFQDDPTTEWIRFPEKKVTIGAGQKIELPYSIAVPVSASPGGHYFALFASVESHNDAQSLKEIRRVASLVYLEVKGDISKKGTVTNFDLPYITLKQPVPMSVRLADQGNVHFDADVRFAVGGVEQDSAALKGLLMPGTVRRLDGALALPKLPGVYKITGRYAADNANTETFTRFIVYAPLWSLLMLAALLTLIIFGIIKKRKT